MAKEKGGKNQYLLLAGFLLKDCLCRAEFLLRVEGGRSSRLDTCSFFWRQ